MFTEKHFYLACPPERDTITCTSTHTHTHLKTILLHAASKIVNAVAQDRVAPRGQGGVILHNTFFAIKVSCRSRFEDLTTRAQAESAGRASSQTLWHLFLQMMVQSKARWKDMIDLFMSVFGNPSNYRKALLDTVNETQQVHLLSKYLQQCARLHPFSSPVLKISNL